MKHKRYSENLPWELGKGVFSKKYAKTKFIYGSVRCLCTLESAPKGYVEGTFTNRKVDVCQPFASIHPPIHCLMVYKYLRWFTNI
jgi:hypothetical protein